MDRDKMNNLYREPSMNAFYQVSVHMAEGLQRRRLKCEKLAEDRRRMIDDGRQTTDYGRQTTDDGRQMTDDGRQVMAKVHIAFGKGS